MGCCRHIAALLYNLVDYYNTELLEVHPDRSCTQTGQKWSLPSGAKQTSKALIFDEMYFTKFDESKKR